MNIFKNNDIIGLISQYLSYKDMLSVILVNKNIEYVIKNTKRYIKINKFFKECKHNHKNMLILAFLNNNYDIFKYALFLYRNVNSESLEIKHLIYICCFKSNRLFLCEILKYYPYYAYYSLSHAIYNKREIFVIDILRKAPVQINEYYENIVKMNMVRSIKYINMIYDIDPDIKKRCIDIAIEKKFPKMYKLFT